MKISYGEKIAIHDSNGTYYTQRILITKKEYKSINLAISSEIAMGYPQARMYANSDVDARMYLKRLLLDKYNKDICFLKNTQCRYISKFAETKGRLKMDRNTYIQVEGVETEKSLIKQWYREEYPNDFLGLDIKSKITFYDAFECLDSRKDFYTFLGVGDSIVRERVFEKLAEIMDCTYDYIYNQWVQ